jgi:hypothetical protein
MQAGMLFSERYTVIQSNLVSSPLVSSPTLPLAKLSLGTDFPQFIAASFCYHATLPLANILGWTNGGEQTRFDCMVSISMNQSKVI